MFKFSAEACVILQALHWPRKHQQVCYLISLLLLFDSHSVLSSIFPFTSISLVELSETVFSLLVYYQTTTGPTTGSYLFLPGNCADEKARRIALLVPSAIPYSLSVLLSLVSTLVFSRTGGLLFHLYSFTHRFPGFPLRNLRSLVTLAVFSLVFVATNTAFS